MLQYLNLFQFIGAIMRGENDLIHTLSAISFGRKFCSLNSYYYLMHYIVCVHGGGTHKGKGIWRDLHAGACDLD